MNDDLVDPPCYGDNLNPDYRLKKDRPHPRPPELDQTITVLNEWGEAWSKWGCVMRARIRDLEDRLKALEGQAVTPTAEEESPPIFVDPTRPPPPPFR